MTVDQVQLTSPLASRAAELRATPEGIRLREVAFLTQLNLRLDPESPARAAVESVLGQKVPVRPGTVSRAGDRTLLWLGPDEWLLLTPPGEQPQLQPALRQAIASTAVPTSAEPAPERGQRRQRAMPGTVVDLSAHRTTLDVLGPLSRELMAKGCSLDLHPSVFTRDRCAQVLLARAPVVLLPHEDGLRLLVRSSLAGYVADWLLDACVEYGTPR